MAPPSRTRYSLPLSQYFQLGGFHNPPVLLHQRAENDSQRKLTNLVTWTTALSSSLKLWAMPCRVTQDRQVMVVWSHKMWSTGEGMANHLSIPGLRTLPGATTGDPTHDKGHAERTWQAKADRASRDSLDLLEHPPQNQNLSVLLYCAFHKLFWH